MPAKEQPRNLDGLLDELQRCAERDGPKVSVEEIREAIGRRSFGPLLLLAGLSGMTPVAGVPTIPSIIAVIILLISVQLVFGRKSFWLPRFLLNLEVNAGKLKKSVRLARKPARMADRVVKPRLTALVGGLDGRLVAVACALLALMTPPLELLPFVAFFPSAAVALFGLALIAQDGLLVLIGLAIAGGALGFAGYQVLT